MDDEEESIRAIDFIDEDECYMEYECYDGSSLVCLLFLIHVRHMCNETKIDV